jgi:L,D-transpeptidase YcbB
MRGILVVLGFAVILPFGQASAIEPDAPERLITAEEAVGIQARRLIDERSGPAERADKASLSALTSFYASRESRPIWIARGKLSLSAKATIDEIRRADEWGLKASAFQLRQTNLTSNPSRQELAAAEIALSLAVLKYAHHARGGRIIEPTKQLTTYIDRKPQLLPASVVLSEIAKSEDAGTYLRELNPQHPQFLALRKALLKQRGVSEENGIRQVRLPAYGPQLRLGKRHPDVAILRHLLDAPVEPGRQGAGSDPEAFDVTVDEAVKAFQRENGLYVDGIVGRNTRSHFGGGEPATVSEQMLLANMEQWRWMPRDLGDFYVTANIPEYRVRVVKDGRVVHAERMIVGKTDKQTPLFSDTMETVVFHPFWGVPNSIKVNEILPSLARGGQVLRRHNLRLQYRGRPVHPDSIDWSRTDIRKFHVYQPPGGSNVLGEVKFLFPNKHQVYMHDTPEKHLFKKNERTFSHGCMRIRDPLRLAKAVLQHDRGWTMDKVNSTVATGPENNNITLNNKVPVHVTYFTAVADEDGNVQALRDIYGHEKRIRLALAGRWNEIRKGRDHLAPVRPRRIVRPQYNDPISDLFKQAFGF